MVEAENYYPVLEAVLLRTNDTNLSFITRLVMLAALVNNRHYPYQFVQTSKGRHKNKEVRSLLSSNFKAEILLKKCCMFRWHMFD